MNATYTLNTKVFNKTKSPSPTGVVLTNRSRGDLLPDVMSVSHKETANPLGVDIVDTRSLVRFDRTYLGSDGVYKTVSWMIQAVIPSDCPAADIAACRLDLTAFLTSAITETAANVAVITNHEVA